MNKAYECESVTKGGIRSANLVLKHEISTLKSSLSTDSLYLRGRQLLRAGRFPAAAIPIHLTAVVTTEFDSKAVYKVGAADMGRRNTRDLKCSDWVERVNEDNSRSGTPEEVAGDQQAGIIQQRHAAGTDKQWAYSATDGEEEGGYEGETTSER